MTQLRWDKRHLDLARHIAQWSKDPRKKVGAVVTKDNYVTGIGYNGFPRGIADSKARLADPEIKKQLVIHAEVNALAAAQGQGDCIYVWPCLPCTQCLGLIIQHKVRRVVTLESSLTRKTKWNPDLVLSLAEEAKIEVVFI
jgi:dCMP deaminase